MSDRRRRERISHTRSHRPVQVTWQVGDLRGEGQIAKTSRESLVLSTKGELPLRGEDANVVFNDRFRGKIELEGTVAWTSDELDAAAVPRRGFGIELRGLNPDYMDWLEELLNS